LRWENPPEGARNLQGCLRHTGNTFHKGKSPEFTGFRVYCTKGRGGRLCSPEQRRTEGVREQELLTEEGRGGRRGRRRWWPEMVAAGGDRRRGERDAREQRARAPGKRVSLWLGSAGWRPFFKNARWAHQTVYSACPVHTGQRTVAVR
jgi:hypothetical protein